MPPSLSIKPSFRQSRKLAVRLIAVLVASILLAACAAATPAPTQDPAEQQTMDALQAQVAEIENKSATQDAEVDAMVSTATQSAIKAATAAVNQTATTEARSARSTATAETNATGTQVARVTATAQAVTLTTLLDALYADHNQANIDALNQFLNTAPPEIGPHDGNIRHDPSNEFVETWGSGNFFEDFVLRVEFVTPYASASNPWDFAVFFRSTGGNSQFRLTVTSAGFWTLDEWQGDINRLANRNSGSIRVSSQADVPMTLLLVVRQNRGLFFVDSRYIGLMDVSHKIASGDLFLGIGAYSGDEQSGSYTEFNGFSVWRVPSP